MVEHVGLDVSDMKGKWEAWKAVVVKDPLPGIPEAYLVLGADKRGTIYALYEHSEQFGVFFCFTYGSTFNSIPDRIRRVTMVLVGRRAYQEA